MATTYPVLLVISLEDAKSAKVQESVFVLVPIFQDMYQVRTPFMARMEELSLPIVLEAGEALLALVLLRPLDRHHILQGEHARNVVVEDMKAPHISMLQHLVLDGPNLITIQADPHVLIVITKRITTTIRVQNVEDSDIIN